MAQRLPTSSEASRGTKSSSSSLHTPSTASAMLPPMFTPPTSGRPTPPIMSSRPRAAASLFGSPSSQRPSRRSDAEDAGDDSQDPEDLLPSSQVETDNGTDNRWIVYVVCMGTEEGEQFVKAFRVDKGNITLANLTTMKSRLGYGSRDYMYYKHRSDDDPAAATLHDIDYDVDALRMVDSHEEEREIRLVFSKNPLADRCVAITPIKSNTVCSDPDDEEEVDESELYAYKDWLRYLHSRDQAMEFEDIYREDTIKTYEEWLGVVGKLDDINAFLQPSSQLHSSQDSNQRPPVQAPSHARRSRQGQGNENGKKRGRGPLKGLKAISKRIKAGNQKMKVEFSRLGGPVGDNYRSFIDEIVMFTRKRAPLIGVRSWKEIHEDVKDSIASDILARWDIEDSYKTRTMIWAIARERYKGWRSAFSATAKAYNSYRERMLNKPAELDIVEWHYLLQYFRTAKFKARSIQNSRHRGQKKTTHLSGAKPYAQCSYEKKDPETGEEPNDMELWFITHSKDGEWKDQESRNVYDKASSLISEAESNSEGNFITVKEKNEIFQKAYKAVTACKSTRLHGNGYLARNPTRRELLNADRHEQIRVEEQLHQEHTELMESFGQLQEQMATWQADREAERLEHAREIDELKKARAADLQALRQELLLMLQAGHGQTSFQQANNNVTEMAQVAAAATNMNTEEVEATPQHEVSSHQENTQRNQEQPEIDDISRATGIRTTRSTSANTARAFVTTKQLKDNAAKKRQGSKKTAHQGSSNGGNK